MTPDEAREIILEQGSAAVTAYTKDDRAFVNGDGDVLLFKHVPMGYHPVFMSDDNLVKFAQWLLEV